MNTIKRPHRRTALKQMAALLGLSLSAHSADTLSLPLKDELQFLTTEQLRLTGVIVEHIIPSTETPGALAAEVHHFIDHFLPSCSSKAEQILYIKGLQKLDLQAKSRFHKRYVRCNSSQQILLLTQMENATNRFSSDDQSFFKLIKTLTLLGYYTSEIGATKELSYLAIPGSYKGDVPFSSIGRAWAL